MSQRTRFSRCTLQRVERRSRIRRVGLRFFEGVDLAGENGQTLPGRVTEDQPGDVLGMSSQFQRESPGAGEKFDEGLGVDDRDLALFRMGRATQMLMHAGFPEAIERASEL